MTHHLQKLFWLAAPVAGILQTFTLAPFNYWWLGPLSITLLMVTLLERDQESDTYLVRKGFLKGWLFGLGLFGSGTSWVYISIHVHGYAPPILAGTLTALFVMGLGLFHGFFFWVLQKLGNLKSVPILLAFVSIWVLGDWIRTWFLTGFPWIFLGYGHLDTSLNGWAPILGVYGITGIVVLSGASLWLLIQKQFRASQIATMAISLLFWLSGPLLKSIE